MGKENQKQTKEVKSSEKKSDKKSETFELPNVVYVVRIKTVTDAVVDSATFYDKKLAEEYSAKVGGVVSELPVTID